MRSWLVAALLSGGSLTAVAQPQDQTPPAPPASQTPAPAAQSQGYQPIPGQPRLVMNLEKIRQALEKPPALGLDEEKLKFYILVYAKQPTFATFLGKFDLKNGPVPRAGMTHSEFLKQVTPKELYATSGGISPMESLQAAVTNMLAQEIIKRGLRDISEAKSQREIQTIRDRIDRELAALAGKG
jgi:hypothetical protein